MVQLPSSLHPLPTKIQSNGRHPHLQPTIETLPWAQRTWKFSAFANTTSAPGKTSRFQAVTKPSNYITIPVSVLYQQCDLVENCTNPAFKRSQLARPEWSVHPSEPDSLGQSSRKVGVSWHYPGWLFLLYLTRQILHYQGWSQTPCLAPTPSPPQKPAGWCPWLMSFLSIFKHHWAKISLAPKLNITVQNSVTTHFLLIAMIAKTYQDRRPSHRTGGAKGSWFQHICLRPPPPAGDEDGVFIFHFLAHFRLEYLKRWVSRIVADI